jgi:leucyl-tRNA synthetase
MGFNTAIAALMEALNDLYKLKISVQFASAPETWRWAIEVLVQLLAPFAPHISEELWSQLGHNTSIHTSDWPVHDEHYLLNDTMTIVVQVNGKVRAQIEIASDATQELVLKAAADNEKITTLFANQQPKKSIYVQGKLVNFVI